MGTGAEKECVSQPDLKYRQHVRRTHPPMRLVFCVGEHPSLPAFGRHFRCCESKISGPRTCHAQPVLERIFEVLEQFFPGHMRWWHECDEENMPTNVARAHSDDTDVAAADRQR